MEQMDRTYNFFVGEIYIKTQIFCMKFVEVEETISRTSHSSRLSFKCLQFQCSNLIMLFQVEQEEIEKLLAAVEPIFKDSNIDLSRNSFIFNFGIEY